MAKYKGDFDYKYNNPQMGSTITDNLLDLAVSKVGSLIETDPAQREKAVGIISDTVKAGIMNNVGLIVTGLFIFGLAMGAVNVAITASVLNQGKK